MSNSSGPPRPGDSRDVDGYRVLGRLGRGGMGTVHLAESPTGTRVALRLIHPALAEDGSFRARFAREVASARRVACASVAAVVDARWEGEVLYVASEYVPGPTLSAAVRADGPMSDGVLGSVALGVAAALAAVHRSGTVHGDLTPSNMLLSPAGPKVVDFGIARAMDGAGDGAARSRRLVGTPSYMAPELIAGQPPAPAGDVFSWGCLVAFAGTGGAPFDAATVPGVLHNISSTAPRLDGLDPTLREAVVAALGKDPRSRPTSQELVDGLVGLVDAAESDVARAIGLSWPGAGPGSDTGPEARGRGSVEAGPEEAGSGGPRAKEARPEEAQAEVPGPAETGPEEAGSQSPWPEEPGPERSGPEVPEPEDAVSDGPEPEADPKETAPEDAPAGDFAQLGRVSAGTPATPVPLTTPAAPSTPEASRARNGAGSSAHATPPHGPAPPEISPPRGGSDSGSSPRGGSDPDSPARRRRRLLVVGVAGAAALLLVAALLLIAALALGLFDRAGGEEPRTGAADADGVRPPGHVTDTGPVRHNAGGPSEVSVPHETVTG
ncbi:serine/threonine-protein kinase [Nocardiopsis sp. NRRL B-16309]|uniref:serine/threonine protein kinase n=1 Tax=Nocardiopsis sp. NRRL B-16309 TaxID=1519494 RepID=UPI0006AFF02E|nr:serine/threonine-protein kinase [Nocardiopsis sp. NRRL B-16309]